jgi:hypothetical protein
MANYPKPTKGSRHNAGFGYKSGIRRQLREDRQVQAKVRQELYDKLSATEKLARLDRGHFQGDRPFIATKQRARIKAQLKVEALVDAEVDAGIAASNAPAPKKARKGKKS